MRALGGLRLNTSMLSGGLRPALRRSPTNFGYQALRQPLGRRGLAFFRKVPFPPKDNVPFLWLAFGVLLLSDFSNHAQALSKMNVQEWVRQAQSETWGKERVLTALDGLQEALQMNHGSGWTGWLNSAPQLMSNHVVERAIRPGLAAENADIVDASAELAGGLLAQRQAQIQLVQDASLFEALVTSAEKWRDINCLDCGNPAPALDSLAHALLLLCTACKRRGHTATLDANVDRIIAWVTEVSKKVEDASSASRRGLFGSKRIDIFSFNAGSMESRFGSMKHSEKWYLGVGSTMAQLCDFLVSAYPEKSTQLIPAFNSLSKALCPIDLAYASRDMDTLFDALEDCPTFELGSKLHASLRDRKICPENISQKDWDYFRKTGSFFEESESRFYTRLIRGLEKLEIRFERFFNVFHGAAIGFIWGSLRTTFALRNVEHPSHVMEPSPPFGRHGFQGQPNSQVSNPFPGQHGNFHFPQGPGAGVPNAPQGMPPAPGQVSHMAHFPGQTMEPLRAFPPPQFPGSVPQQHHMPGPGPAGLDPFHSHNQFNYPAAPGWKTGLIFKHGRIAAFGTAVMVVANELGDMVGHVMWIEDMKTQFIVAAPKILFDLALFLGVLRTAPFTFVPTMLSIRTPSSDLVAVETTYSNDAEGRQ